MSEQVKLLSAEMAEEIMNDDPRRMGCVRLSDHACDALEAIERGAAVVIPAADRVDVAKVRAVIEYIRDCATVIPSVAEWAKELESALGKETGS